MREPISLRLPIGPFRGGRRSAPRDDGQRNQEVYAAVTSPTMLSLWLQSAPRLLLTFAAMAWLRDFPGALGGISQIPERPPGELRSLREGL
jgi:hypothetical protein